MDDLGLKRDEQIILTTPDVVVKSVPFEAILTNMRILLVDRKDDRLPPKEIALETVRHTDAGENAIRDPILTLWINAGGETRQMILTFPQRRGAGRKRDRDEWASRIRNLTEAPARSSSRTTAPSFSGEPKKKIIAFRDEPAAQPPEMRYREEGPARNVSEDTVPPVREAEQYGTFCSKCGNRLAAGSLFCNRCGSKTVVPKAPVRPEPAMEEQEVRGQYRADTGPSGERFQQPARAATYATGRTGPHREKRGFLSWLFPKKKAGHHAAPVSPAPKSRPRGRGLPGPSKKTLMTIGIIAVAVIILAVAGYAAMNFLPGILPAAGGLPGSTGSGSTATPTAGTTLAYNAVSTVTVVHTRTPIAVPAEGVSLYINYLGSWEGTYTVNGATETLKRSGEYIRTLEDASGPLEATFTKGDGSSHELIVKIYKDGAELDSETTTAPNGEVTVSADMGEAAPTPAETE